jgi:adenylate kinase
MRIVMLGPPGSGKGTWAQVISEMYDIPVISTGDILRKAARKKTERGITIRSILDKGELVPSEIVNELVKKSLERHEIEKGYILDGYPRNKEQAKALERTLEEREEQLDYVLYVDTDDEIIIERLSMRRICPNCGAVFHLEYDPPKEDMICDECESRLIQRKDDKPTVLSKRLKVYRELTEPLLDMYRKKDLVKKVPGDVDLQKLPCIIKAILG